MIFVMALIGAITRLTESGLSIMEWAPVTGVLPPLSTAEWERVFALYQQIPEYREVNAGMSLEDFKAIFWWEYIHPPLGPLDRRGLSAALSLVPAARQDQVRPGAPSDCHVLRWAACRACSVGSWWPAVSPSAATSVSIA